MPNQLDYVGRPYLKERKKEGRKGKKEERKKEKTLISDCTLDHTSIHY